MSTRWTNWLAVGSVAGLVLTGCPGKKDQQALRPLSELKEREAQERSEAPAEHHEPVAQGSGEGSSAAAPDEHEAMGPGWTAYSTGVAEWREPTGGREAAAGVVFGPGSSGGTQRYAYNTDTTGAVSEKIGTGVSYGASTGTLEVLPGTPQTRADNYPTVQKGAAPSTSTTGPKKPR